MQKSLALHRVGRKLRIVRLREQMSQKCRCSKAAPDKRQHLSNIRRYPAKILDQTQRAFLALLPCKFVDTFNKLFLLIFQFGEIT